jgi:hypothetical protein
MTTPARIHDPNAGIPDSVFAAAEEALTVAKTLRAEVEGSDFRKNLDVRNIVMRGSGHLLTAALRLLALRRTEPPACQDAGNGPPDTPTARDDPTAA